ncbi:hypothetical protein NC651_011380 [Populus alba x Populus x berolinensis]|nr:hypothetical protein NC651_011380 [Populus alba x Populus x berolinensis]
MQTVSRILKDFKLGLCFHPTRQFNKNPYGSMTSREDGKR